MKLILEVDQQTYDLAQAYIDRVQRSEALRSHYIGEPLEGPHILGRLLRTTLSSTQQQILLYLDELLTKPKA